MRMILGLDRPTAWPALGDYLVALARTAKATAIVRGDRDLRKAGLANPPVCTPRMCATRRALPPVTPLVSTPREAFFADHLRLPIAEAIGRVAAESLAVYPPGIPNVLPGERLTRPVVQHILEAAADGAVIRGAMSVGPMARHALRAARGVTGSTPPGGTCAGSGGRRRRSRSWPSRRPRARRCRGRRGASP